MTSITRWLKGFWSGTRNDPERDAPPIVRESSTSLSSRPIRPPQTSQPATNTPELLVSPATGRPSPLRGTISITNGGRKYTGAVHLFPVGPDDLDTDAVDGLSSEPNNNNNTWTSDRGIRFEPALDAAPELEAASSRPNPRTTSSSSGPSIIQGNASRSVSRNEPFTTSHSERASAERGTSSSSRTERGSSSPHDRVFHSASSTATLSPRSVTVDVERQRSNSGTQDTGNLNCGHKRRELPSTTNNFNRGLVDSPPTPPASSAFYVGDSYTSPVVKQERLSPAFAPTPPAKVPPLTPAAHEARNEPEMQQVARQTIEIPFRTPSKPVGGSTTGSHASSGLMTPPDTNSARRPAVASISGGARVKSSSPPPSPCPDRSVISESSSQTSTTSSGTTSTTSLLAQSQANGWDASPLPLRFTPTPSSSPAPASQRQTGRPFRPPIQEDPTLNWTSIRELVAAPLVNGRRILPRYGPTCSRCRQVGQGEVRWVLQEPTRGGTNVGRAYYSCPKHKPGFGTFADLEGEDVEGGKCCECPGRPLARRTERKDGGVFWKCLEMKCSWSEG